jgi:hypothetical protein
MEQLIPNASVIKEDSIKPLLHVSQQIVPQIQNIFFMSGKKGNHPPHRFQFYNGALISDHQKYA